MSASQPKTMRANGTIVRARFSKIDPADNNSVLQCGTNEKAFGVSQIGGRTSPIPDVTTDPPQAAQAGENVQIFTAGQECLLQAGSGGWTAGDYLKSDTDGKGVNAPTDGSVSTQQRIGAIALETVSEDELGLVQSHVFNQSGTT